MAAPATVSMTGVGDMRRQFIVSVSVIIPTHERPDGLRQLLGTLIAQDYPTEAMELIVAHDGNDKETVTEVEHLRSKSSIRVKYVQHNRESAAATRNLGASVAEGDYLLFVDDDCEVDRHWVDRTVAALMERPDIGEVACRIDGASKGFFARCHDYARYYPSMQRKVGERRFACGCAFGMRRFVFDALDGFDESIKTGEDEDLGLRMQRLGYRAVFRPECVVYHNHGRTTLAAMLSRAFTWASRGEVDAHLNHPKGSTYGRFASGNPYFYLLLSPLIAAVVTLRVWLSLLREVRMPMYLPFIFCDKVVWCWGTYRYLRRKGSAV
jgi:GT2 family glycosyltransferase